MTESVESISEEIESAKKEGWKVKEQKENGATLIKRSKGSLKAHIVVAVLTIWWTFGIGNVCYFIYKYYWDTEKRVISGEQGGTESEPATEGEQPETDTPKEETASPNEQVELLPIADERYSIVYSGGKFVGSIPGVRLIFKLFVIYYRIVVLGVLEFLRKFRGDSLLIKKYIVDTYNIYDHFFAGYRGESKPDIRYSERDSKQTPAMEQLERLKDLHDEGALTDEEFEEKKSELLDDI